MRRAEKHRRMVGWRRRREICPETSSGGWGRTAWGIRPWLAASAGASGVRARCLVRASESRCGRAAIAAAAAPGVRRAGESAEPPPPSPCSPKGRRCFNLPRETDRGWRERRSCRGAARVGRGMRDRRADPAVIDHCGRRRREPARPPPHRLRIRRGARRLRPPHRRAAWRSNAARQGRGDRDRSRL